jgi:hypothetical protein
MNGLIHAPIFKRLMKYLFVIFAIFTISLPTYAAKPDTIPALQQWTDGTGSFIIKPCSRIVLIKPMLHSSQPQGKYFKVTF